MRKSVLTLLVLALVAWPTAGQENGCFQAPEPTCEGSCDWAFCQALDICESIVATCRQICDAFPPGSSGAWSCDSCLSAATDCLDDAAANYFSCLANC